MPEPVVIRPATVLRAYMAVFSVVWVGGVGAGLVAGVVNGSAIGIVIPLFMMTVGAFIIGSNLGMRVVADGDELKVRNFWKEHAFTRGEIDRFALHSPGGIPARLGGQVTMLLHSGRLVDLRATASGPFGQQRREGQLEELQAWLAAPPKRRAAGHG